MRSVKFILRGFIKNSRLNLINISSMAIGITAAIIVLTYVYQEFNYDSQYKDSESVYRVLVQNSRNELSGATTYGPLAQALKADFPEIEDATRLSFYWGYLALEAGENRFNETETIFADPNFFTLFSFPLEKGDATNCLSATNSIVISESAAKKYFVEEDPLGKQIKIGNHQIYTVQGVFKDFPKNSNFRGDIILPLEMISKLTQVWIEPSWKYPTDIHTFILAAGNSASENISVKIKNFLLKHVKENPEKLALQSIKNLHTERQTGWESVPQANKSNLYLLAVVGLVILAMSAANFLLLHIGMTSQRTINNEVKKVCGASKSILMREYLKEALLYMTLSIMVSLLLIYLYKSIVVTRFSFLPEINDFDTTLLLLLGGLLIIFALFSSVLSSLLTSAQKPSGIFKSNPSLQNQPRFVNVLVIGQFTIGVALLAVTTLFYKQIHFLEQYNPGFVKEELITVPLNMHIGDGIYNENMDVFCEELKKHAGVKNVTLAFSSPANIQTSADDFNWEGKPVDKSVTMQWNAVFFDYFETLGIQMAEGRSFNRSFPGDMLNEGNCSFILNEKAIEKMELNDPIGKSFEAYGRKGPVVGIVSDFNFKSLHSEISPMCFNMNPFYYNEIIVRINPQSPGVLESIENVWNEFVPKYPFEFSFVDQQLDKLYESEKKLTASINAFAGIAILIACMGLLALTILSMQKRTKEIGIRKVNGAKVSEVLLMLNKDFIKWVVIAFVIATPIAYYAMNKWLQNFAYKTTLNWWIFALAGLLALAIALLTVSWQSWRAATRNPVEALRYE